MSAQPIASAETQATAVICDDDKMTRQIVREIVGRAGYSVIAGVGTALDALKLTLAHRPDVLVLDLVMPGMPGEDIIASIHECSPETQVIVHSAFDPTYAIRSGARLFVSKGQFKALEETLNRINGESRRCMRA